MFFLQEADVAGKRPRPDDRPDPIVRPCRRRWPPRSSSRNSHTGLSWPRCGQRPGRKQQRIARQKRRHHQARLAEDDRRTGSSTSMSRSRGSRRRDACPSARKRPRSKLIQSIVGVCSISGRRGLLAGRMVSRDNYQRHKYVVFSAKAVLDILPNRPNILPAGVNLGKLYSPRRSRLEAYDFRACQEPRGDSRADRRACSRSSTSTSRASPSARPISSRPRG